MTDITTKRFSAGIVRLAFLPTVKWHDRGIETVVNFSNVHRGEVLIVQFWEPFWLFWYFTSWIRQELTRLDCADGPKRAAVLT